MPGGKGKGKKGGKAQVEELTTNLNNLTTSEAASSASARVHPPAGHAAVQGLGAPPIHSQQHPSPPVSTSPASLARAQDTSATSVVPPSLLVAPQPAGASTREADSAATSALAESDARSALAESDARSALAESDDRSAAAAMDDLMATRSSYSEESTSKTRKVSAASILSTFYPKFENESADALVRQKMEAAVAEGRGVLEVSVKHSGSLFMWAGAQRGAFAKNSYGNEYSAVGVWVLGETLKRAWGPQEGIRKQRELSDYLQTHRLALAMELVTSVLGDHGQRPLQDYAVITAVVDLHSQPRFFATPDVVRLCRQWRLPSNHYWLFQSRQTVAQYMAAYQALSEEGTATTVEDTLARIADVTVPATADHLKLQGNIMEGLVGRIVSPDSVQRLQQVLEECPVDHQAAGDAGAGVRLRTIYGETDGVDQRILRLVEEAGPQMCSTADWGASEGADPDEDDEGPHLVRGDDGNSSSLLSQFLECSPGDDTTSKLQEVVRTIKRSRLPVRFKCRSRPSTSEAVQVHITNGRLDVLQQPQAVDPGALHAAVEQHFVITVHAYADSAFRKYQRMQQDNPELWPLYRGFFIEVFILKANANVAATLASQATLANRREPAGSSAEADEADDHRSASALNGAPPHSLGPEEPEHLMLKMKFLPYKLRTFLIRNGLRTLFKEGTPKYLQYCTRLLEIWGTSTSKTREMMSLCRAWAALISSKSKGKALNQNFYLDEAEPFLADWAKRSKSHARAVGALTDETLPEALEALELEEEEAVASTSESNGHAREVTAATYQGLLIFFPGIPGCGKSALCEALIGGRGLGDGRKLDHLMGDVTLGKYWKILGDRRKKNKKVASLADKNAPNRDVWEQVEQICSSTDALGIPVIPASEGLDSNPYDWETLAVLLWRVLQRKNHPGKLDGDLPTAGFVVLMFFHLYDGMDRGQFEEELRGRFGTLVTIPVMRPERPPFPQAVVDVLQEGDRFYHRLQGSNGNRRKKVEPQASPLHGEWLHWETRMRNMLRAHEAHIRSIQVPFEDAVRSVQQQLSDIACGRVPVETGGRMEAARHAFSQAVQLASLHLPQGPVWTALQQLAEEDKGVHSFLAGKEGAVQAQLGKSHVTLAHKRSHGAAAVARYAGLVGAHAEVRITALLHSPRTAALEVEIREEDKQRGLVSLNPFPHITVWTAPNVPAATANQLPDEVAAGTGARITFSQASSFRGTVQFG